MTKIVDISPAQLVEFLPDRQPKTKFPWDQKKVGEAFFVSASDVSYRPAAPERLKRKGQQWSVRTGNHPELGEGYFAIRMK